MHFEAQQLFYERHCSRDHNHNGHSKFEHPASKVIRPFRLELVEKQLEP